MNPILAAVAAHAIASPDAIAIDGGSHGTMRWAELDTACRAATELLRAGLPGTRPLALERDTGLDLCLAELALLGLDRPVVQLPAFFTPAQRSGALTAAGCDAILTQAGPGAKQLAAPFAATGLTDHDSRPQPLPAGTGRISFTSGSTGDPRGLCLGNDHLAASAAAVVDHAGRAMAGRHLAILPPGILLETVAGFYASMIAGGTYVAQPAADVGMARPFAPDFPAMVAAIQTHGITSLILVPEYLRGLVMTLEASGNRLPALTMVAVGGARVPLPLIERAVAVGLPVRQGYGLTECGSVVAFESGAENLRGSVGRSTGLHSISIAPDGEILIDGPAYLGTIGAPRAPGPLHSGDIGRIDPQGRLWIEGRKSNLIVTSFGRNISPEWIEEALLAQPGIAQAMVHGDGLPAPAALLVPSGPDADLAAAVRAANASLPAYARIGDWREVSHFTPGNGLLTGNGRLRRDAIAVQWLAGEPSFFAELEAATVRDRLRFVAIPQLQAGLSGAITRDAYLAYLAQAYHHVRHTVPLLKAARARLAHRDAFAVALDEYIEEETGHEEWILSDIAAGGGDSEAVRHSAPAPATRAMVDHAYDRIANGNPASFFGMIYVLESVSIALAQRGATAVAERLGLPSRAFTYLTSHGALDQDHLRFFAELVNDVADAADRQAIVAMAKDIFRLYGAVFASIDLEAIDVAA